ncbi:MAG: isocitrate lyase [Halobacteriovoraceae bacterium]|nr:isocitrate lyase [Halobacteriovoraceae bacterium]
MSYVPLSRHVELSVIANNNRSKCLFTNEFQDLLVHLHRKFDNQRKFLLAERQKKQAEYDSGKLPKTESIDPKSKGDWKVSSIPADLQQRRVEITGPVNDTKMVINMLSRNSAGARADMAMVDFEDSMKPSWINVVDGIYNVIGASKGELSFRNSSTDKAYQLDSTDMAGLMVRVRGLHLQENNVKVDGEFVSAGLFDLAMNFYQSAQNLIERKKTPKFYVPKIEYPLEARWWNSVFSDLETQLGHNIGTLRATFLIETLTAAFNIEEILYEIREHAVGMNVGRWDKIFSDIKTLRMHPDKISPDRAEINMKKFWMENYAKKLVNICHKHGAFAIGGMSAFTPGKDEELRSQQTKKVTDDKSNEFKLGHDGCWVSHPYFIGPALECFPKKNQIDFIDKNFKDEDKLIMEGSGPRTLSGLKTNIQVAIAYLLGWSDGLGCIAHNNLMEDLATLEISRAQVWQWLHYNVKLESGEIVTQEFVEQLFDEEYREFLKELKKRDLDQETLDYEILRLGKITSEAKALFTAKELAPFLTTVSPNESHRVITNKRIETMEEAARLKELWEKDSRWQGVKRDYTPAEVLKLRGSYKIEHSIARLGAENLWRAINEDSYVNALGALTGNQAVQQVKAGLKAIYLSGWQVAADANLAGEMYPDQSLYPADSVPSVVRKINQALIRCDQLESTEGNVTRDWLVPIMADAEAGFGGVLNAYELMKAMIAAGAAGVHFEDQLASEKKCGHLGGKVLVPTSEFIKKLTAARLAADVMDVPTILVARTDAQAATLLTSDVDERDRRFIEGDRTPEGFFRIKNGLDTAIARGLAYAPYADLIWCETSTPDLDDAKRFAEAIQKENPGKMLAYNCSPSFNWKKKLDASTIAKFQKELGAMGYKFQFVTLAGFHSLNYSMFSLAQKYKTEGMTAYSALQEAEFAAEEIGYTATKHQREVGTGYFDAVSTTISQGKASTLALKGSTEEAQF